MIDTVLLPVKAKFKEVVPPSHKVVLPVNVAVGFANTVIVPVAVVKLAVLELLVAISVTLINVYEVVLVGVPFNTLNAAPLVTGETVTLVEPLL